MIVEKNGRDPRGKITRHINIINFFMLDGMKYGEVIIKYCQMEDTIMEYFTKPLQESKFRKFKGKILNV